VAGRWGSGSKFIVASINFTLRQNSVQKKLMRKIFATLMMIAMVSAVATSAFAQVSATLPAGNGATMVSGKDFISAQGVYAGTLVVTRNTGNTSSSTVTHNSGDVEYGTYTELGRGNGSKINMPVYVKQTSHEQNVIFTLRNGNGSTSRVTISVPGCTHQYVDAVTVAPTCVDPGEVTFTCEVCGDTHTMALDPLGHELDEVYTAPQCGTDGYWTYTCTRCGYSEVEVIAGSALNTGHQYVDAAGYEWDWYFFLLCGETTIGNSHGVCTECSCVGEK
jgi:hypothetical protein